MKPVSRKSRAAAVDLGMLVRPIVFQYPERPVSPASWIGHVPFASWIVDTHRPRVFVEVGTRSGNSYCAFLQAIERLQLDCRCFALGDWREDAHGQSGGEQPFAQL